MVRVIGGSYFGQEIQHLPLLERESVVVTGKAKYREIDVCFKDR
jgi:hypothetical protein